MEIYDDNDDYNNGLDDDGRGSWSSDDNDENEIKTSRKLNSSSGTRLKLVESGKTYVQSLQDRGKRPAA